MPVHQQLQQPAVGAPVEAPYTHMHDLRIVLDLDRACVSITNTVPRDVGVRGRTQKALKS